MERLYSNKEDVWEEIKDVARNAEVETIESLTKSMLKIFMKAIECQRAYINMKYNKMIIYSGV